MAVNGIKYSATSQSQALKKGSFWIATNDVPKPYNTDWYTALTPPAGGYSIYVNKASGGPSIFQANSDTDLIYWTRSLSGQTFATGPSALNWYNTQTDKMVFNIDYPPVVTDGLVLNVDAGFTPSYPKGGTGWFDLGPSGNNATLLNGPSFNATGGGAISMDGSDDYAAVIPNPYIDVNSFTWSAALQGIYSNTPGFFFIGNPVGSSISPYKIFIGVLNSGGLKLRINYNNVATVNLGSLTDNLPYVLTITYDGTTTNMYVNGVSTGTSTSMSGPLNSKTYAYIGSTQGATEFFNGRFFNTLLYNRALTSSEVTQNYQSLFPRLLGQNIVANGLVLYLNSGYTPSYPGSGTAWNNIAGVSGGNGTLTNGPTYSSSSGGVITFDGTDDYVATNLQTLERPCTFSVWVNFTSLTNTGGAGWNSFFGQDTSVAIPRGRFYFQKAGGTQDGVFLNRVNFSLVKSDGNIVPANANSTVIINRWYNYVAVLTSSSISVYENGILQSTVSNSDQFIPANTNIVLNAAYYSNNVVDFFPSRTSSFQIYNRSLSSSEVLQNYQASLPQILTENIVTNGMVAYYDAGYLTSYPATGSSWYDVAGVLAATGALINGPTFATGNGGAIVLDGTDDYIDCGTSIRTVLQGSAGVTFDGWFNLSNVTSDDGLFTIRAAGDGNWFWNIRSGGNLFWIGYSTSAATSQVEISNPFLLNTWTNITTTYTSGSIITYINGSMVSSRSLTGTVNITSGALLMLGNYANPGGWTMSGKIGNFKIYNRYLTPTEVLQNFNAQRNRYGI